MKKDSKILLKLSEQQLRELDAGWFNYVYITGQRVSRSEYVRIACDYMNRNVSDIRNKGGE